MMINAKILADKKGSVVVQAVAAVFSVMFIFSAVYQYARLCVISDGVRGAVRDAVITGVTGNFYNAYDGLREGNTGTYRYNGGAWEDAGSAGSVAGSLKSALALTQSAGALEKLDGDGSLQYSISDLDVEISNTGFASNDGRFCVHASYSLGVPVSFFLVKTGPVVIPMSADVEIEEKF